jgi:hypothetical protein
MQSPVDRIEKLATGQAIYPVPRGELWMGTEVMKRAGFTDTLENHFRLAELLGQDMVCLSVADDTVDKPNQGYRYFQCSDLKDAARNSDRFLAAVVDGPFQALVNRMGLMGFLTEWIPRRKDVARAYEVEQVKSLDLIRRCLDRGVHAVVMTDDFAADNAPYISPSDIETLCSDFYHQAVSAIHGADAFAFLHSCGNITRLAPLIKAWQLDGLSAVQHRSNDLISLHRLLDSQVILMAGIEGDLLESNPTPDKLNEFEQIVGTLAPLGGLILSSCCGLYSGDFLGRLKEIYAIADGLASD